MHHRLSYLDRDKEPYVRAVCQCGWGSKPRPEATAAVAELGRHIASKAREKYGFGRANSSPS